MHFVEVKGILSQQNGMNIYRGCSHGCIYCDSRSTCYGFTHDFEDIEVKKNAPELLEYALKSKRKKCMIGTGSMCDPYLHIENDLKLTRTCLELIEKYGFGVTVLTKSTRILRDLDILKRINEKTKCVVQMTLTTYDDELCKLIEPNVEVTSKRVEALKIFRDNNIPTVVWLSPILPFINDTKENIEGIMTYCEEAKVKGIINFGMGVTLREGDREYFYDELDKKFPGIKNKYIRTFGNSYECTSKNHRMLYRIFADRAKANGIIYNPDECFSYLCDFPEKTTQLSFDDLLI